MVNDLSNIVTWSHLADDQYRVETSYIFLYLKAPGAVLPPTPSLPFPQSVPNSPQPQSSDDDEDILIPAESIEKQIQKEAIDDSQGRKIILRNQKPSDPQYDDVWFIFLSRVHWKMQWFAIPLIAIIKTLKEIKIEFRKPPPRKNRKNWNFEEFFSELFHAQPGT